MNFSGEWADRVRRLFQGVVEVAPRAVRGQAVALLNRFDKLDREAMCSSEAGAQLWWAAVEGLLAEGDAILERK
ncbi:hypothetical protein [Mycobacterium nebraskense]|uniref:hypothetical protein n=1 Tax=Mycobacterium nebraskense TaxID=244292 RepID=UPI00113FF57C|nr:hypothetical protein [Mycobacterium nebraskense]